MSGFPLSVFFVLLGLAVFGGIAIIPYSFNLNKDKVALAKVTPRVLALISFVQTAILMAIAAGVGLLAAGPIGLGAPYLQAALSGKSVPVPFVSLLPLAIGLGVLSFLALALLERFVFGPHMPEALRTSDVKAKPWARFLASFYGGINEEILTRLFLVSGFAWIISRFWKTASGMPADSAYWTAIVLAAVLFGLGHLPATKAITPLTTMIVIRAIVLNGVAAITFGWLFWRYGLETAMVAHFSADILIHVVGPEFISHVYKSDPKATGLPE
jgi:hypothetical protein